MRRRALLTGATGFVGRHLVERLADSDWEIRALVRPTSDTDYLESVGAELVVGDVRSSADIATAVDGVDVAFHLAAVTAARTDAEYAEANAEGTSSLVEGIRLASRPPRKLIYLSSYAAAGPALDGKARLASDDPAPLTAYGRSKLAGEVFVREAEADGLDVIILRAPAVYGPGDKALLPYFRLIRSGIAPVPGGEDRRLQLVFAPDLGRALEGAANIGSGTFAVSDPSIHRWSEVVRTIADAFGKRPLTVPLPPVGVRFAAAVTEGFGRLIGRAVPFNREKAEEMLAPAWVCDLSGSESILPPDSVTPLARGIEQTIRWYIRQGWL